MVVPLLLAVLLQSHDVRTVGDATVRSDVEARTKAIYADLSSAGPGGRRCWRLTNR